MRRNIFWIVILAAVASTSIAVLGAQAKDCTRINGPFGYYGNPWCDTNSKSKGSAAKKRRIKRKPAHRATRKRKRSVTEKVNTRERKETVKGEIPSKRAVETENSSIARISAEPEKSGEQTALESETKPVSGAASTNSAGCSRYIPTVKTVSVPCEKGDGTAATCKQYLPTVKTVSVPCE